LNTTIKLIASYCLDTGFTYFTYDRIRRYYYKNIKKFEKKEWHTIAREIRKLCEKRLLYREYAYRWDGKRRKQIVFFHVTDDLLHQCNLTKEEIENPVLRRLSRGEK